MLRIMKVKDSLFLMLSIFLILAALAIMVSEIFRLSLYYTLIIAFILSLIPGSIFLIKQSVG
jgi:hypothetical protein